MSAKISLNKSVKLEVNKCFLPSLGATNECKYQVAVHSVGYFINGEKNQWFVVSWEDFLILFNSTIVIVKSKISIIDIDSPGHERLPAKESG